MLKFIEIRDNMTCIPAIAISGEPDDVAERFLWHRAGYGDSQVILMPLERPERASYDPYAQPHGRTMHETHKWLEEHFAEVESGQVVDVRVILGEQAEPVVSERLGR